MQSRRKISLTTWFQIRPESLVTTRVYSPGEVLGTSASRGFCVLKLDRNKTYLDPVISSEVYRKGKPLGMFFTQGYFPEDSRK
ncbi:hypothetical protein WG66_009270 [Moniliophthora roreri]|nr:hypothetical protein WG66_009270 [Moniliophthora roreri]